MLVSRRLFREASEGTISFGDKHQGTAHDDYLGDNTARKEPVYHDAWQLHSQNKFSLNGLRRKAGLPYTHSVYIPRRMTTPEKVVATGCDICQRRTSPPPYHRTSSPPPLTQPIFTPSHTILPSLSTQKCHDPHCRLCQISRSLMLPINNVTVPPRQIDLPVAQEQSSFKYLINQSPNKIEHYLKNQNKNQYKRILPTRTPSTKKYNVDYDRYLSATLNSRRRGVQIIKDQTLRIDNQKQGFKTPRKSHYSISPSGRTYTQIHGFRDTQPSTLTRATPAKSRPCMRKTQALPIKATRTSSKLNQSRRSPRASRSRSLKSPSLHKSSHRPSYTRSRTSWSYGLRLYELKAQPRRWFELHRSKIEDVCEDVYESSVIVDTLGERELGQVLQGLVVRQVDPDQWMHMLLDYAYCEMGQCSRHQRCAQ